MVTLVFILKIVGAVVGVASTVVGSTRYRDAQGPTGKTLAVLDALSVATHTDSPGTFKRPLKRSTRPVPR